MISHAATANAEKVKASPVFIRFMMAMEFTALVYRPSDAEKVIMRTANAKACSPINLRQNAGGEQRGRAGSWNAIKAKSANAGVNIPDALPAPGTEDVLKAPP